MGNRQWHRAETVVLIDVLHHIKPACDQRGREKDAKNQSRGAQRLSLPIALLKATMSLRRSAVVGRRIAGCGGFVARCTNKTLQLIAVGPQGQSRSRPLCVAVLVRPTSTCTHPLPAPCMSKLIAEHLINGVNGFPLFISGFMALSRPAQTDGDALLIRSCSWRT